MPFRLLYHPNVKKDIAQLDQRLKTQVKVAIEARLASVPQEYGDPLRKTLKGYWKLRVGDYRVVFKIRETEVWILGIIHRKAVYETTGKRTR